MFRIRVYGLRASAIRVIRAFAFGCIIVGLGVNSRVSTGMLHGLGFLCSPGILEHDVNVLV